MSGKTLKYVRTSVGFTVFHAAVGMHSYVARRMNFIPVSAGFINWIDGLPVCHGRSESLDLDARADDTAALRAEWGIESPSVPAVLTPAMRALANDFARSTRLDGESRDQSAESSS